MAAGLLYSIVAAFGWGTYLFALKRYFHGYPATVLTVLINGFGLLWYLPVAVTTVDPNSIPDPAEFGVVEVAIVVGALVMAAAGFVTFLAAIEVGEVSYVAPISKITPVFVLPIEVGLLGTVLTPLQVAGVVVVTVAVYVANYRKGALLDPLRRAASSRPAQFALLSAFCYAVSDVGKRMALQELSIPVEVWVPVTLGGIGLVLLPGAVRSWSNADLGGALPKFAAAGALVAFSEHVTSMAFQVSPASIASPIVNTQAVITVVLGGVVLREEAFRTRLAAAVLAVVGVTLIAL